MNEKTKEGYLAGIGCIVSCIIFFIFAINNVLNTTAQILWSFTGVFGVLGGLSIWKPDSAGTVVSQFLKNFAGTEEKTDSHNKQTQNKSDGIQVMTRDGDVNINIPQQKKQKTQDNQEKNRNNRKEKTVSSSTESCILDLKYARYIALLCQTPRKTEYLKQQYTIKERQSRTLVLGGYNFNDYMKKLEEQGFLTYQKRVWTVSQEALEYIAKYHGG